jgi:ketosteroid isomerase-like protein
MLRTVGLKREEDGGWRTVHNDERYAGVITEYFSGD